MRDKELAGAIANNFIDAVVWNAVLRGNVVPEDGISAAVEWYEPIQSSEPHGAQTILADGFYVDSGGLWRKAVEKQRSGKQRY